MEIQELSPSFVCVCVCRNEDDERHADSVCSATKPFRVSCVCVLPSLPGFTRL